MAQLSAAANQYWAVTPSNTFQAQGPIGRLWSTGGGTLALTSGDGSTFTITVAAGVWTEFKYPIVLVGAASGATGIIAEGWGASTNSGVAP